MEVTIARRRREKPYIHEQIAVDNWNELLTKYHVYEIAALTGLHEHTIRPALKYGLATDTTAKELNRLFKKYDRIKNKAA